MNILYKAYCRIYQTVFRLVMPILPWRKPQLIEGENSILQLPKFIKSKNIDKVLIVTDKGLSSLGMVDGLKAELEKEGVSYAFYDKTVPNPTIDNIEEALKIYNSEGCKGIIAFGGGSPMDCAKGIGARVARPKKSIPQMKGVLKVLKRLPPLFAVPTTAGTGSEATLAAVISNSITHEKYPLNDTSLIPHYAVLDPMLTKGLPKHITSTTGMDALTHAVEAYIGKSNTKETETMAKDAVKLIFKYLKTAYDNGNDLEARKQMQLAALFAGIAFTRAYVGYVHAVAHTLGGMYSTPHGLANSVILPYVLEYYGTSVHQRLAQLADLVGITQQQDTDAIKAEKFIQAIKDMNEYMQIPTKIKGIKDEDIPLMAKRALKEANPLYPVPKFMGKEEITQIYNAIKE